MGRLQNETDLEAELFRLYREGVKLGYRGTRSYQMFMPHCKRYKGGVRAVKLLLELHKKQTGFKFARDHKRLDLSVEALVLRPEWIHLFDDADRSGAAKKLAEATKLRRKVKAKS
jgi:hypothetical protein